MTPDHLSGAAEALALVVLCSDTTPGASPRDVVLSILQQHPSFRTPALAELLGVAPPPTVPPTGA